MDHLDPTSVQEAMEVPITASLGPMGPLLQKLHHLGIEDEIRPLKVLCISLKNMSEDEDASLSNRWWMKLVRELLYDAEDQLDEVSGAGADSDFSELLARVEDTSKRCKRFQLSSLDLGDPGVRRLKLPGPFGVNVNTRGRSTVDDIHMVPPNKLAELLALDEDKKTLKVIPIHGCPGVGKTTVARALYHKHGLKFQCRAFVSVSQNPDMRGFLSSMLSQLKAPRANRFPNVPDLINSIRKHLEGKRYFIVIDDLWTAPVWNLISRAFPHGDYCSRIVTTTQMDDVALACCNYDSNYIYKMGPLNDLESRKVFFGILFGSEDCCPTNMEEVSYEIIRRCWGLPIAIVNIASLLASESNIVRDKLEHLQDSLPSTSEGMADGLNLIYNSLPQLIFNCLPPRLRTCLLYLSIYPHGYVIKKVELVKQWVAEGFLSPLGGRDTEEIAEGYFDELVSRGMVQAMETNNNGDVLSVTVHQMVLDFIKDKSMEENFVITVDHCESTLALPDKVRRLSVQLGGVKSAYIPESIITSHVRSLIFWGFFECVPYITDYGLLQVLILHIWADQENESVDLTMIHELFRLKYLKIECNITVKLPDRVRRLTQLGTLHVDARLFSVPSDIVCLERLLHLRLPSESILPKEIAHMTSLRTLGYFDLNSDSEQTVLHLGQLTNLQDLQLTCSTVQPPAENLKKNLQLLGSVIQKLSVLQSVTLVPGSGSSCAASIVIPSEGFGMVSPPPPDLLLRRVELSRRCCIFFSLPTWFGELRNLCTLKIAIRHLWEEDIDILKRLPSLIALSLYIQTATAQQIGISNVGFQVLMYFKFVCRTPCLSFEQGAMPKVQRLNLGFNAKNMELHTLKDAGFCYLTYLREISVKFGASSADELDITAAESALEAALSSHPSPVIIRVQCVDEIISGEKDKSIEEREDTTLSKQHESREGKRTNREGSEDTALEERHKSQEGKRDSTGRWKGESFATEEIEDTVLERQDEIEEDKEALGAAVSGSAFRSIDSHASGLAGEQEGKGSASSLSDNRWPPEETLALLHIRSEMDAAFRDAALKGPLWEEVSRRLAEMGHSRSAKRCREKFERVNKYYRRTKDVRTDRSHGKTFFTKLRNQHGAAVSPRPPTPVATITTPAITPAVTTIGTYSSRVPTKAPRVPAQPSSPPHLLLLPQPAQTTSTDVAAPTFLMTAVGDMSFSDSDEEDTVKTADGGKRKRRGGSGIGHGRKAMRFIEGLMQQVMDRQEAMQNCFLDLIERRDQDRMIREDAWRRQEVARLGREAQERAMAASHATAIMSFIQRVTRQMAFPAQAPPSSYPSPPTVITATKLSPLQPTVSRRVAEMGHSRNTNRCREKLENVHKYYRRTKDDRSDHSDGKTFFTELEDLHGATASPHPPTPVNPATAPPAIAPPE